MTVTEFCQHYPKLYHMTEAAAWPGIREHGLLSTSALLDLYEVREPERSKIESCRRPDSVLITHPQLGTAFVNDQRPLSDAGLRRALTDMTPADWYKLLNSKVFFWVNESRLARLLGTYRNRDKIVLVLDTAKVMARHSAETMLCPINSGFTRRFPQPRGSGTFRSIADYPFGEWIKKRGVKDAIAECAVNYKVSDVEETLIELRPHPRGPAACNPG